MDSEDLVTGNSCCQDFTSITHDGKGEPLPHRCCKMGEGKMAILVPRLNNVTSEDIIKRNLGNNKQASCQHLDYGFMEKIKFCQIHATNISSDPVPLTDRSLLSITGITTVHQTADLPLVICTSVVMTSFL